MRAQSFVSLKAAMPRRARRAAVGGGPRRRRACGTSAAQDVLVALRLAPFRPFDSLTSRLTAPLWQVLPERYRYVTDEKQMVRGSLADDE